MSACLQEAHISKLKEGLDAGGDASLQNGLDLAVSALKSVPPYGHREVCTSDKPYFYPTMYKYSKKESHPCSALKTCCSKLYMMALCVPARKVLTHLLLTAQASHALSCCVNALALTSTQQPKLESALMHY